MFNPNLLVWNTTEILFALFGVQPFRIIWINVNHSLYRGKTAFNLISSDFSRNLHVWGPCPFQVSPFTDVIKNAALSFRFSILIRAQKVGPTGVWSVPWAQHKIMNPNQPAAEALDSRIAQSQRFDRFYPFLRMQLLSLRAQARLVLDALVTAFKWTYSADRE